MISYDQLEKPVLGEFGIRTSAQLMDLAGRLKSGFDQLKTGPPLRHPHGLLR
jgi:hypothetical protein